MTDGVVYVDGVRVSAEGTQYATCHIEVTGNVTGDISTMSGSVTVHGSVGGDAETMSGAVHVGGDVAGDVSTMSGSISTRPRRAHRRGRRVSDESQRQ
jgi:cytoskeletal protein CcmA (bactofilin family)